MQKIFSFFIFLILFQVGAHASYEVDSLEIDRGPWHKQLIYYPKTNDEKLRFPIVVISHGNGHNYKHYTYLQKHLASHGYITTSHTNLTGPGIETASTSTLENTDIFLEELPDLLEGNLLKIADISKIAWIGHSRGAEGVVRAYTRIVKGYTPEKYSKEDIKFISSIAPTTFLSSEEVNPMDVNYHMFVGGADGDVTGQAREVVMSMPIYERAYGEKHLTYLQGAGHNVFNDMDWDEGRGPDRLEREEVHEISKGYYLALLNLYLSKDVSSKRYMINHSSLNLVPGLKKEYAISSEYKSSRTQFNGFVIDDFQENESLDSASSEARVEHNLDQFSEGILQDEDSSFTRVDAMNGMTRYIDQVEPPRGAVFEWNKDESYLSYHFDGFKDLTQFKSLSLRAAQISQHHYTLELNGSLVFSVLLTDDTGETALLSSKRYVQLRTPYLRQSGWASEFNTLMLPLKDFKKSNLNINLAKIQSLTLKFGDSYGSSIGRLSIDDLELLK